MSESPTLQRDTDALEIDPAIEQRVRTRYGRVLSEAEIRSSVSSSKLGRVGMRGLTSDGPPVLITAPARRRGRPRSEEANRAILRAATALLAERGLHGMSIEEVASRAGVAKATIYRRWHSRGTLALDAFPAEFKALQPPPDTGTLREDLLAALRAWVRAVPRTPAGRILADLIAEAQHDPELADAWRARVVEPLRAQHRIMLKRAIDRGQLPASTDPEVALDLLYGSAYHRLLNGHQPLNDTFVRRVVDVIAAGLGAAGPASATSP